MFKLVLVFGLFLSLAFAQDADCPFDPCSRDLPSNCTYSDCIHLGQCNRVFVNEAGSKVCPEETSSNNCPPLDDCFSYCSYGYEVDEETGCLKCECREPMNCENTVCVELTCEDPARTIIPTGLCCPTCLPACDKYEPCKVTECGPEEIDISSVLDCCPVCLPKAACDIKCPEAECSDSETRVSIGCCDVCVPTLDCSLIQCPDLGECLYGVKYSENSCCPKCAVENPCADIESCPELNCTSGEVPVRVDGECCERCRSVDYCDKIACPEYSGDCPAGEDKDFMIQRDGTCCPYCPTCRDTDRTRCDRNDRSVCAPGYWRGTDCSEEVPANERLEIRIEITVSGISLEVSDIKTFIANKLEIDPVFITVTNNGDTYTVIISDDATNPSLNFGALQEQVDEVIESSSFFNKATSSGSAQLLVPITALASCIAMFL